MSELVRAEGLSAGYYGQAIVRELDLDVAAGEIVALLGPNGAGKTTTLLALAGELPVLSGRLTVLGSSGHVRPHARARAGMAFVTEQRSVFMKLTAADNLRVGRCDVARALDLFPELEPLMGRLGGQLSGGEQQILTLARALARRPRLLLADELSLGLAPKVVNRLLTAVRRAATEDGVGVVLVEQHVDKALRHAHRAYAMRRGEIVLSGSAAEVGPRLEAAYLSSDVEAA